MVQYVAANAAIANIFSFVDYAIDLFVFCFTSFRHEFVSCELLQDWYDSSITFICAIQQQQSGF